MSLFLIDLQGVHCVFVHIPKTGGTSIRKGKELSSAFMFQGLETWKDLPSFGFVRNPIDRLESCYKDFRYLRPQINWDFNTFIRQACNMILNINQVRNPTTIAHHVAPMSHPVHGLKHAKFVGLYERLQKDFDKFCEQIGVKKLKLAHYRSSKKCSSPKWNTKSYQLVKENYAEDFQIWDDANDKR